MENPWKDIKLNDYENHMKLDSVMQLQAMSDMMYSQFYCYPVSTIMVLGIAGGNGLSHIDPYIIQTIYGVDINCDYLKECVRRYPELSGIFFPIQVDLQDEGLILPKADIIVANLLIEYIGYTHFQHIIQKVDPLYVTCAIQVNTDESFVSNSPYLHVFDGLEKVHHQINEYELKRAMERIKYKLVYRNETRLPNGKKLVRLDYHR